MDEQKRKLEEIQDWLEGMDAIEMMELMSDNLKSDVIDEFHQMHVNSTQG